jgi:hypothetical protein
LLFCPCPRCGSLAGLGAACSLGICRPSCLGALGLFSGTWPCLFFSLLPAGCARLSVSRALRSSSRAPGLLVLGSQLCLALCPFLLIAVWRARFLGLGCGCSSSLVAVCGRTVACVVCSRSCSLAPACALPVVVFAASLPGKPGHLHLAQAAVLVVLYLPANSSLVWLLRLARSLGSFVCGALSFLRCIPLRWCAPQRGVCGVCVCVAEPPAPRTLLPSCVLCSRLLSCQPLSWPRLFEFGAVAPAPGLPRGRLGSLKL